MSQAGSTSSGSGGSGIQTILGDSGSITGSTVTIFANNATVNSGSSVKFVNAGTVSTFDVTDGNKNTLIGMLSGNLTLSGVENTGLGRSTLSALTTGHLNTAVGYNCLNAATTGNSNVAIGTSANSFGNPTSNTAVGSRSLLLNGGTGNTALGANSLPASASDSNNTALGFQTLQNCDGGIQNTAVGANSLQTLSTGNDNVVVGYSAMSGSSGGANNSIIGALAFQNCMGQYNTGLGYSSGSTYNGLESDNILINSAGVNGENNVLRIGDLTGTGTGTNSINAAYIQGIYGNNQPVAGSIEFVTIDNTTGLLGVTTTAAGSVTLTPDTGHGSPVSGADINIQAYSDPNFPNNCGSSVWFYGDTTTTPQTMLLNVTDGSNNTFIGLDAGNGTLSGTNNTALGFQVLSSLTTGTENTVMGYEAGNNITTGSNNTALGFWSQFLSTADTNNTSVGYQTLFNLDGGSYNVAIGSNALSQSNADSYNVAIGSGSLQDLNGGTDNTAVGTDALKASTSGSENVAVGRLALNATVSDSDCVAIGSNCLKSLNGGNQNTALGSHSLASMMSGADNIAIGYESMQNSTSCNYNTVVGTSGMQNGSGNYNTVIGYISGFNYHSTEGFNILINSAGVGSESNVLHIGDTTGPGYNGLTAAYIQGIYGNSQPISGSVEIVTINNTTGKLGVTSSIPVQVPWSDQGVSFNAVAANGYFTTAALTATLPMIPNEGDTISFAVDSSGTLVIQANIGQIIRIGSNTSTTAGTASSTFHGDSITIVFRTATNTWFAVPAPEGSWTLA